MDRDRAGRLLDSLRETGWWGRAQSLGTAVRRTQTRGGLLVVGTPDVEPWHLAAHLDDEARWTGQTQLEPTLVRWAPPPGAPAHLAYGLERLGVAGPGQTIVLVTPDRTPAELLERVADAKALGATVVSVDGGDPELDGVVHERMTVGAAGLFLPSETGPGFDLAQHLVSTAAGREGEGSLPWHARALPRVRRSRLTRA